LKEIHAAGVGKSRLLLGKSQNISKDPCALKETGAIRNNEDPYNGRFNFRDLRSSPLFVKKILVTSSTLGSFSSLAPDVVSIMAELLSLIEGKSGHEARA